MVERCEKHHAARTIVTKIPTDAVRFIRSDKKPPTMEPPIMQTMAGTRKNQPTSADENPRSTKTAPPRLRPLHNPHRQ
jgi:hypothetical protein